MAKAKRSINVDKTNPNAVVMRRATKANLSKTLRNRATTTAKTPVKTQSIVIPRKITALKTAANKIEAYRSSISNMFTDNDATLTNKGYLREFTDTGYVGDVIKANTIYEQDDLVGGLIDAQVNNANTKINFDLASENAKEAKVWETWSRLVNADLRNVLPGLYMLNNQLINSLYIGAMAIPDIEWGELTVGKQTFTMPMKISIIPTLGCRLQQDGTNFGMEQIVVGVTPEYEEAVKSSAISDEEYTSRFISMGEGDDAFRGMIRPDAYAIKYNYNTNRPTLYPTPLLKRSFESIALRHKYIDADISTLEMLINKIIQIKVGDKDNPPKPDGTDENGAVIEGDISIAQALFESLDDIVEVIATPYYYTIEIVKPDTSVLLDQDKYVQTTFNIYSNFGIILDPSSKSNTGQFEEMNLNNYRRLAINMQEHLKGWYTWLVMQIIKRNPGKLKATPKISFEKPDVYDVKFLAELKELYLIGGMDITTLMEKFGLDADKVVERKKAQMQLESTNPAIFDARASFKQVVGGPTGETKEVTNSDTGGTNDKNRGIKQ